MNCYKTCVYSLSFFCLLMVLSGCNAIPKPTESSLPSPPFVPPTLPTLPLHTPAPLPLDPRIKDLLLLKETLTRFYPRQPELEEAIITLEDELPSLSTQETIITFMQFVKQFSDERMTVTWEEVNDGFEMAYPLRLTWFDEGLYVTETTTDHIALLGTRLVRMHQTDILSALQEVEALIPPQSLHMQAPIYLSNPGILYGLHIAPGITHMDFLFEDTDGHLLPVRLSAIPSAEPTRAQALQWSSLPETFFPAPLPRAANYWFTYIQQHQTLYVQYNRCESLEGLAFDDFVADLRATAQSKVVDKLIVDLRTNPGGAQALNDMLFAGIYGYMAQNPNVDLFVMVASKTQGAAQHLALQLRHYTPAILVSAPEAQPLADISDATHIHLPYSKLDLWYVEDLPAANKLKPDLVVAPKAAGYANQRDPLVEAVIAISVTDTLSRTTPQPYTGTLATLRGTPRSESWRQDLYHLIQEMESLPEISGGYCNIVTQGTFKQAVADLEAAIPALEDHKVVVGMMQLLAMLGDAHTRIPYWEWEAFERTSYPLQVQWFSDGLFVTAVQPGYENLLGLKILQIGDIQSEQVLDLLKRVVPHENSYGLRAASAPYLVKPVILHAVGLAPDLKSVRFVFEADWSLAQPNSPDVGEDSPHENQDAFMQYLPAIPSVHTQNAWISALAPSRRPLYLQQPQDIYYWYTYLEDSQTLYFQYNVCGEMEDRPFWEFTREMFASMQAQAAQRLVIDLRRNNGGRIESISQILINLQQYPEFTQQGRLFVLIGEQTFSSAVYLASLIRETTEALFIGEPTAQGPNFYASFRELHLPYSGLVVHYPTTYWKSTQPAAPFIAPDIWVRLPATAYFNGMDPVLEAALSYGQ